MCVIPSVSSPLMQFVRTEALDIALQGRVRAALERQRACDGVDTLVVDGRWAWRHPDGRIEHGLPQDGGPLWAGWPAPIPTPSNTKDAWTSDSHDATAPRLIVVAGPNGSGKSTWIGALMAAAGWEIAIDGTITMGAPRAADAVFGAGRAPLYINADDIARQRFASVEDPLARNLAAANEAERQRREALSQRRDLLIESVLSTPGRVALLGQARALGYHVHLVVVATNDPRINITRVRNRVRDGGHDVPAHSIVERWVRGLGLVASAMEQADAVTVVDNSRTGSAPWRAADLLEGRLVARADAPTWVEHAVIAAWAQRRSERLTLQSALGRPIHRAVPDPDVSADATVVASSATYVVTEQNSGALVRHDRALVADARTGRYAFDAGGKILAVRTGRLSPSA